MSTVNKKAVGFPAAALVVAGVVGLAGQKMADAIPLGGAGNDNGSVGEYATIYSDTQQIPSDTNPLPIDFDQQVSMARLTHSTSVDPSEITIQKPGVYEMTLNLQWAKSSGSDRDGQSWVEVDDGGGFTPVTSLIPLSKLIVVTTH